MILAALAPWDATSGFGVAVVVLDTELREAADFRADAARTAAMPPPAAASGTTLVPDPVVAVVKDPCCGGAAAALWPFAKAPCCGFAKAPCCGTAEAAALEPLAKGRCGGPADLSAKEPCCGTAAVALGPFASCCRAAEAAALGPFAKEPCGTDAAAAAVLAPMATGRLSAALAAAALGHAANALELVPTAGCRRPGAGAALTAGPDEAAAPLEPAVTPPAAAAVACTLGAAGGVGPTVAAVAPAGELIEVFGLKMDLVAGRLPPADVSAAEDAAAELVGFVAGPRVTGTPADDTATAWTAATFETDNSVAAALLLGGAAADIAAALLLTGSTVLLLAMTDACRTAKACCNVNKQFLASYLFRWERQWKKPNEFGGVVVSVQSQLERQRAARLDANLSKHHNRVHD